MSCSRFCPVLFSFLSLWCRECRGELRRGVEVLKNCYFNFNLIFFCIFIFIYVCICLLCLLLDINFINSNFNLCGYFSMILLHTFIHGCAFWSVPNKLAPEGLSVL